MEKIPLLFRGLHKTVFSTEFVISNKYPFDPIDVLYGSRHKQGDSVGM